MESAITTNPSNDFKSKKGGHSWLEMGQGALGSLPSRVVESALEPSWGHAWSLCLGFKRFSHATPPAHSSRNVKTHGKTTKIVKEEATLGSSEPKRLSATSLVDMAERTIWPP
ncbi:hypothetical protein CRG98_013556 [Punica granatum]|uniref:Uncharacterized protein n=1 Tax=Punica granatum TaxID=22663 RepID=A0A2I0KBZ5_PUNGR|nr:hypothetical protein CRG98_013556 [Punica granatum]